MDDYLEDIVSAKFDELDYIESFDDYRDLSATRGWLDEENDGEVDDYFNE